MLWKLHLTQNCSVCCSSYHKVKNSAKQTAPASTVQGICYTTSVMGKGHWSSQKYRVIQNDYRGHTQYTPDANPFDFFL